MDELVGDSERRQTAPYLHSGFHSEISRTTCRPEFLVMLQSTISIRKHQHRNDSSQVLMERYPRAESL